MNRSTLVLVLAWPVLAASRPAVANGPTQPLEPPSGFGVKRSGHLEQVVCTESTGEFHNAVHRQLIEEQCEMARKLGMTDRRPTFEPGYDHPIRTETWRYSSPRRSAHYRTVHAYVCAASSTAGSRDAVQSQCSCTYRTETRRTVQIKKWESGRYEFVTVDLFAKTAARITGTDHSIQAPERDAANVLALAPEALGHDVVAGLRCTVRRQRLGTEGWIDRCLTGDDPSLPPQLRFQTLWEVTPYRNGHGVHSQDRVTRVVTRASVDAAVFEVPQGVQVKDLAAPGGESKR